MKPFKQPLKGSTNNRKTLNPFHQAKTHSETTSEKTDSTFSEINSPDSNLQNQALLRADLVPAQEEGVGRKGFGRKKSTGGDIEWVFKQVS